MVPARARDEHRRRLAGVVIAVNLDEHFDVAGVVRRGVVAAEIHVHVGERDTGEQEFKLGDVREDLVTQPGTRRAEPSGSRAIAHAAVRLRARQRGPDMPNPFLPKGIEWVGIGRVVASACAAANRSVQPSKVGLRSVSVGRPVPPPVFLGRAAPPGGEVERGCADLIGGQDPRRDDPGHRLHQVTEQDIIGELAHRIRLARSVSTICLPASTASSAASHALPSRFGFCPSAPMSGACCARLNAGAVGPNRFR